MSIKEIAVKGWLSVAFLAFFCVASASAAPRGGEILSGSGDLSDAYNIRQYTDSLRTSWNSFDISAGEEVRIHQPSSRSSIVIGVRNGVGTQIDGTLSANGRVVLENPAGVEFGAGSVVNVGGLLASASSGSVSAQGVINAPSGEVHLKSLSKGEVVNVGGAVSADRIIVEGANEVRIGSSASLTANKEVLVGGDFQGKGDITNSQKTIVESGALITSPRVIIWSDVRTNFQGNIEAGNGFVEVSGKKSLASFDLFNVNAGELLLDPENIVITDTIPSTLPEGGSIRPLMRDGDSVAADDVGDKGETIFYIRVGHIRNYLSPFTSDGAYTPAGRTLILAANNNITVDAIIPAFKAGTPATFAAGNLTLTAGTIDINASIQLVSGDFEDIVGTNRRTVSPILTITATKGKITFGSTSFSIYADTINLSQVGEYPASLPTFRSAVPMATASSLSGATAVTPTKTDTTPQVVVKTPGAIEITIANSDTNGNGTIDAVEIIAAIEEKFDSPSGEFDVTTFDFTINTTGDVVFPTALTGIRTSGNISLTIGGTFSGGGTSLTLTTETGGTGNITLSGNFGVAGKALTITSVGQINFTGTTTLTGAAVTLTTGTASAASGAVTLVGTTSLTLIGNTFNFGTNDLTLESPMINEPTIGTRGALTIDAGAATLELQSWMDTDDRNLTLKTTGALAPVTFDIGSGTLTLAATGSGFIRLPAHPSGTTLTAGNVILTSANAQNPETNGALTITAATSISLTGMFSTGDRAMTLTATNGTISFTNADLTASAITLTQAGSFGVSTTPPATFSVKPAIYDTSANANYPPPTWASCLAADTNCNIPQVDIDITQANDITLMSVLGGFEINNLGVLNLETFNLTLITNGKIIVPSNLKKITTSGTITIVTAAGTGTTTSPSAGENGDEDVFSTGGISGLSAGDTLTIETTGGAADTVSSTPNLRIAHVFAAQVDVSGTKAHPEFNLILKTNGKLSLRQLNSSGNTVNQATIRATNLTLDARFIEGFGNNSGPGPAIKIYGTNSITFKNLVKVSTANLTQSLILNVDGVGGISYSTTGTGANAENAFSEYAVNIENTHNSTDALTIGSWALQAARTSITSTTRPVLITESVTTNILEITAPRIIFDGDADIEIKVKKTIRLNTTKNNTDMLAFANIDDDVNGSQNLTIKQEDNAVFVQFFIKGVYNLGGGTLTLDFPNLTLSGRPGSNSGAFQEINITELNARAVVLNFIADADGVNDKGYFFTSSVSGDFILTTTGTIEIKGHLEIAEIGPGAQNTGFAPNVADVSIKLTASEITFTDNPTIIVTGASSTIELTQTEAFAADIGTTSFRRGLGSISGGANAADAPAYLPILTQTGLTGGATYAAPSWGACPDGATDCLQPAHIDIAGTNITAQMITEAIEGKFEIDDDGVLDLGDSNFTLNPTGTITFPDDLLEIKTTGSISITATSVSGFAASDTIKLTTIAGTGGGNITLAGSFGIAARNLEISSAGNLTFTGTTTIIGSGITITSASATTPGTKLTIDASAGVTLAGAINVATLDIQYGDGGGSLAYTTPNLTVATLNITAGNSASEALTIASWMTGATTALTINAAGIAVSVPDISFSGKNLEIIANRISFTEATPTISAADLTLTTGDASGAAAGAVTLTATGTLDLTGNFNLNGNTLTLNAATLASDTPPTFTSRGTLIINASGALTLASWMEQSGQDLTVTATGNITLASINIGGGSLSLTTTSTGTIIVPAGNATLTATNVTLNAAAAPASNARALTINATTGTTTLIGRFRADSFTITTGTLATSGILSFNVSTLTISGLSGSFTLADWMPRDSGDELDVQIAGDIIIPAGFSTSNAGTLILKSSGGALDFQGAANLVRSTIDLQSNTADSSAANGLIQISATNLSLGGSYDFGTGNVELSFSGTFTTPTALTTDDLTITKTNAGTLTYAAWMLGSNANRNLTLTTTHLSGNITIPTSITTNGTGTLTLNATNQIRFSSASVTLSAHTLSLTARSTDTNVPAIISTGDYDVTFTARTGGLTIFATLIDLKRSGDNDATKNNLTLSAGGTIQFTKDTTIKVNDIKLGGTVNAGTLISGAVASGNGDLEINAADAIIFSSATTITGTEIRLSSAIGGTPNNTHDVQITSTGNLTLSGLIQTSGTITLKATAGNSIEYSGDTKIDGGSSISLTSSGTPAAPSAARNVTLDAEAVTLLGAINLGAGTLFIESNTVTYTTRVALTALAVDLTLNTSSFDLAAKANEWLIPATTDTDFDRSLTITTIGIGGSILLPSGARDFGTGALTLASSGTGAIIFASGAATTIKARSISLNSTTGGTQRNQDLTLETMGGDITLQGTFNIGLPASTEGDLVIIAVGGEISFTGTPAINGKTITLTQSNNKEAFNSSTSPATFNVKPAVKYTGADAADGYLVSDAWATCSTNENPGCSVPVPVRSTGEASINLATLIAGKFSIVNGVLDLGSQPLELQTGGAITFPSALLEIKTSGTITISAGSISGWGASVKLTATGEITLSGAFGVSTKALTIDAGSLTFASALIETTITGSTVSIKGTNTASTPATAKLTITATGNLTLDGPINVGTQTLALNYGTSGAGSTLTYSNSTDITFGELEITNSGTTALDIVDWMAVSDKNLTITASEATVNILAGVSLGTGNLNINTNKINFGVGFTQITAGDITLATTTAASNNAVLPPLSFTASGTLSLSGDYDFTNSTTSTNASITLSAATFAATPAPTITNVSNISLAYTGTGAFTPPTWAAIAGVDLSITADEISLPASFTIGTGDLTLTANEVSAANTVTRGALTINLAEENGTFLIETWAIVAGKNLTIDSGSVAGVTITIPAALNIGAGALSLTAATLNFGSADVAITAATITLSGSVANPANVSVSMTATGKITFTDTAGLAYDFGANTLTLSAGEFDATLTNVMLTAETLELTYTGATAFNIPAWATANITNLSVTTTEVALNVPSALNIGSGDLDLRTTTANSNGIVFARDATITAGGLTLGSSVASTLASSGASDATITFNLSGSLTAGVANDKGTISGLHTFSFAGDNNTFSISTDQSSSGLSSNSRILVGNFAITYTGAGEFDQPSLAATGGGASSITTTYSITTSTGTGISLSGSGFGAAALTITAPTVTNRSPNVGTNTGDLTLNINGATDFTIPAWAIRTGKNLTIASSTADINVPAGLVAFGNGNLTLMAMGGSAITFADGATLEGGDITLYSTTPATAAGASISITASGALDLSGSFNLGTTDLVLSYASVDATILSSLTTDSLAITSSEETIDIAGWMVPTSGRRSLSITSAGSSTAITTGININLGGGILTLVTTDFSVKTSNITLTAGAINITAKGDGTGASSAITNTSSSEGLTLSATAGNITISADNIDLRHGGEGSLNLSASGQVIFSKASVVRAHNITIGGDIRAAGADLTLNAANAIVLDASKATSITAGTITLTSTIAGATSKQNFTLTADGNINLSGLFDVGNEADGGEMNFSAGNNGDNENQSSITLNDGLTLTARSILLTQNALFPEDEPTGVTFTIFENALPNAERTGGLPQTEHDWFEFAALTYDADDENIIIADLIAGDSDQMAFRPFTFDVATGILSFGEESVRLITTGQIIFPAGITAITAASLTLEAASIGIGSGADTAPATAFSGNLAITLTANLILKGALTLGDDLTLAITARRADLSGAVITAPTFNLTDASGTSTDGDTSITAATAVVWSSGANFPAELTLATPSLVLTSTASEGPIINLRAWMVDTTANRNLSITAAGKIVEVSASANLGTGDLTINARTLLVSTAAVSITAKDISITASADGTTSGDAAIRGDQNLTLIATGDIVIAATAIHLTGGFTASTTSANGIVFSKEATTLTATNIIFGREIPASTAGGVTTEASKTGSVISARSTATVDDAEVITASDLTLTTAGAITFIGKATISGAAVSLDSAEEGSQIDADLTINATGDLTIAGMFNAGTGIIRLVAGASGGTGDIVFTPTPTLRASSIRLQQNDTPFTAGSTAPATFTTAGNAEVKPRVKYLGAGEQQVTDNDGDWFVLDTLEFAPDNGSDNVDIAALLADTNGDFSDFSINADGLLDFGTEIVTITTTGKIIFPAGIREIRAAGLVLTAASIGIGAGADDGDATAFSGDLTLTIQGRLTLNGILTMGADTSLTANVLGSTSLVGVFTAPTFNLTTNRLTIGSADVVTSISATGTNATGAVVLTTTNAVTFTAHTDGTLPTIATPNLTWSKGDSVFGETSGFTLTGGGNLTLAYTGEAAEAVVLRDWMVATDRNLSLTATGEITLATADLGAGTLTLSGLFITTGDADVVLTASAIRLTTTEETNAAISGDQDLTLIATGDITIAATAINLSGDFTASAGGNITFTKATTLASANITFGRNVPAAGDVAASVIGSTIRAQSTADGETTEHVLVFITTAAITFIGETTITGAGIGLVSLTEGAASNADLTITASNGVVLSGLFNTGTGDISVTSGADNAIRFADGTNIVETVLKGGAITLTSGTATAEGIADEGGTPAIGSGHVTVIATGAVLLGGVFDAGDGTIMISAGTTTVDQEMPINFSTTQATSISGGAVTLTATGTATSGTATASNQALTITASGELTLDGDYDLGTGALTLNYDSISAPIGDITASGGLTIISANAIEIADWMVEENRNLSITTDADITLADIDLGTGTLTLSGDFITTGTGTDTIVLTASAITLTASAESTEGTEEATAAIRGAQALTLIATGDINITATEINLTADFTASAGGNITFTKAVRLIAANITFGRSVTVESEVEGVADVTTITGSTIRAQSTEGETTTQHNLVFITTAAITFIGETTITGAAIGLISATEGAASDADLTIRASDGVALGGLFNTGTGDISVTSGADNAIRFTDEATVLKGGDITLTSGTATAEGMAEEGGTPDVGEGAVTITATGAVLLGGVLQTTGNITITAGTTTAGEEMPIHFSTTQATTISGAIVSLTATGTATSGVATASNQDLRITASGALTLAGSYNAGTGDVVLIYASLGTAPTALVTDDLTITSAAAITIAEWMVAIGRDLFLTATNEGITLADVDLGTGTLTLSGSFLATGAADVTLMASAITITTSADTTGAAAAIRNTDNQNLTLVATAGNISIGADTIDLQHGNTNTGTGDLSLSASGEIIFTKAADVKANDIAIGGVVRAQTITPATDDAEEIVAASHNLTLTANGALNFAADKPTAISGADITLASAADSTPTASGQNLTIVAATGAVALSGNIDLGRTVAAAGTTPATTGGILTITSGGDIAFSGAGTLTAEVIAITATSGQATFAGTPTIATTTFNWSQGGAFVDASPATLTVANLNLTRTADDGITFAAWMAATDRNLSIAIVPTTEGSASAVISIGSNVTLGAGNLSLSATRLSISGASIIMAGDVNIVLSGTGSEATSALAGTASLGITASGSITIHAQNINFASVDLTLTAGDDEDITFTHADGTSINAQNITIGGVVRAQSTATVNEAAVVTQENLSLIAGDTTGQINFATEKATSIFGAVITLTSPTVGTTSTQNLTVTATGNLALSGGFDVGVGRLDLIAGDERGDTGVITFADPTALTASFIKLSQDGALFPTDKPTEVTFNINVVDEDGAITSTAEGAPRISYLGAEIQGRLTWATQFALYSGDGADKNIDLMDAFEAGNPFADEDNLEDNIVDFTDEDDKDFIVNADEGGNLILPDMPITIKANRIVISADKVGTGAGGNGVTRKIVLEATEIIIIDAEIAASDNIEINAPIVIFSKTKPVTLTGMNIMIDTDEMVEMPDDVANNQNVNLIAMNDIELNNNLNIGFGTLVLRSMSDTGSVRVSQRNVRIVANRVVYDAGIQTTGGNNIVIETMNDIILTDSSVMTAGNVILRAGGSIVLPDGDVVIQAGEDIILEQRYGRRSNGNLTLTAGGDVNLIGTLYRGAGNIAITAGGAVVLTDAEALIAAQVSITQADVFSTDAPRTLFIGQNGVANAPALVYTGTAAHPIILWGASLTCSTATACR